MTQNLLVLAGFLVSSMTAAPAIAQEIQYWGLWQSTERGLIRFQDQYYTVGTGDEIPGLGHVEQVTAELLIVQRTLASAEQQGLAEQGRVVPDVEIRRIPNLTNRVVPSLIHGEPGL